MAEGTKIKQVKIGSTTHKIDATTVNDKGVHTTFNANDNNNFSTDKAVANYVTGLGYTSNTGTVTSVSAGTGLKISSTASVTPKVEINTGYKLPTTTEWEGVVAGNDGRIGFITLSANSGTLTTEQYAQVQKDICGAYISTKDVWAYKMSSTGSGGEYIFISTNISLNSIQTNKTISIKQIELIVNKSTKAYNVYNKTVEPSGSPDLNEEYNYVYNVKRIKELMAGKQALIDSSHKLSSDLIDDTNNTNKFITSTQSDNINKNLYNLGAFDTYVVNSDGTVTITRQTGYVYSGDILSAGYEGTSGGNKRFKILTPFTLPGDHTNANIICNKYTHSPDPVAHWDTASDKTICIYGNAIYVIDNDYSNGAEFKASLKDFQFQYKLSSSYTEKAIKNIPYYDSHYKEPVLLWENGSPGSGFGAQTVNLAGDFDTYKTLEIVWSHGAGSNIYEISTFTSIVYNYASSLCFVDGNGAVGHRDFKCDGNSSLYFYDGMSGSSGNSNRCIPIRVYGLKVYGLK